jgi:hypothetical protein
VSSCKEGGIDGLAAWLVRHVFEQNPVACSWMLLPMSCSCVPLGVRLSDSLGWMGISLLTGFGGIQALQNRLKEERAKAK